MRCHLLRRVLGVYDNYRGQFFGAGEDVRSPRDGGEPVERYPGGFRDGVAAPVPP